MAEKYALENDTTQEYAIKELLLHEEDRELWAIIKSRLKDSNKTQLDKIWIDSTRGSRTTTKINKVEIEDTELIHKKLLSRN